MSADNGWPDPARPGVPLNPEWDGEALARIFHEAYERLAPSFGYETRKETRTFDPTTLNGRLMIAVCSEIAAEVAALRARAEGDAQMSKDLAVLREAVADAIATVWNRGPLAAADAAIRAIAEATREPSEAMLDAFPAALARAWKASGWRAMYAASPLGEALRASAKEMPNE